MSEVDKMNGVAYIDKDGVIVSVIRNELTYMTVANNNIQYMDRPFYHGLLMDRQQIQQIIDNRHLFDSGLVNAAYLLINFADSIKVEYSS